MKDTAPAPALAGQAQREFQAIPSFQTIGRGLTGPIGSAGHINSSFPRPYFNVVGIGGKPAYQYDREKGVGQSARDEGGTYRSGRPVRQVRSPLIDPTHFNRAGLRA